MRTVHSAGDRGVHKVPQLAAPGIMASEPDRASSPLAAQGHRDHWSQHDHRRRHRRHHCHCGRGCRRAGHGSSGRCFGIQGGIAESTRGATSSRGRRQRSGGRAGGGARDDSAAGGDRAATAAASTAAFCDGAIPDSPMHRMLETRVRSVSSSEAHLCCWLSAGKIWPHPAGSGDTAPARWWASLLQQRAGSDASQSSWLTGRAVAVRLGSLRG